MLGSWEGVYAPEQAASEHCWAVHGMRLHQSSLSLCIRKGCIKAVHGCASEEGALEHC